MSASLPQSNVSTSRLSLKDVRHQRVIALNGTSNFRDLGGYSTPEGTIKWGQVYRSAHLADLDTTDQQTLQHLGVQRSIDLRGARECKKRPYDFDFITRQACSIEPVVAQLVDSMVVEQGEITTDQAHAYMQAMYTSFYTDHISQFQHVFEHLCTHTEPTVLHCTAGKDRTGFAVALLLDALGVHHDDILEDYLLTQAHYHPVLQPEKGIDLACMKILWGVSAQYLEASFKQLRQQYGSVRTFSEQRLGLSEIKLFELKQRLLNNFC